MRSPFADRLHDALCDCRNVLRSFSIPRAHDLQAALDHAEAVLRDIDAATPKEKPADISPPAFAYTPPPVK